MTITYHPAARQEALEIAHYYLDKRRGLAASFVENYEKAIARLVARPRRNRCYRGDLRRQRIDRFPYHVCYRIIDDDTIRILIVRHSRRHWDYGLDRT